MPDFESIKGRLERIDQEHILRFYSELPPDRQRHLLSQIDRLPLDQLPTLIDRYVKVKPTLAIADDIEPAPFYPSDPRSPQRPWDKDRFRAAGERLLREGKVAAFTVAGGQGSRLGYDGPKGCFPGGAVTGKPLFQIFAEGLLAAGRKYGRAIPWYIMTSPLNHEPTVAFFAEHEHFGLEPTDITLFPQGVVPSLSMGAGRMLLAEKDEVATNPDGHGGSLTALHASGSLADMRRRGVQHISYFQVDNPIVKVVDPAFIGLHAIAPDSSAEMSSKMIPKTSPEEKVGVFAHVRGRTEVIEYSDLPPDLAQARSPDGTLRFLAGSIAVHMLSVDFVERLNTDESFSLPYHRAEKKVPHIDLGTGKPVDPEKPNAVKLERFVFDALPLCRHSIVLETDRIEEFAPIKNATGVDSVESSREIQTERAARWLAAVGAQVPRRPDGKPDCVLEINPLTALEPADLKGRTTPLVERGAQVVI